MGRFLSLGKGEQHLGGGSEAFPSQSPSTPKGENMNKFQCQGASTPNPGGCLATEGRHRAPMSREGVLGDSETKATLEHSTGGVKEGHKTWQGLVPVSLRGFWAVRGRGGVRVLLGGVGSYTYHSFLEMKDPSF